MLVFDDRYLTAAYTPSQTASSIAAEGGNWKILEDLESHGAKANDAALIEALAIHNHLARSFILLIQWSKMSLLMTSSRYDVFSPWKYLVHARLDKSLRVEEQTSSDQRTLTATRLSSIFTKTCAAGHPECAARVSGESMQRCE